MPYVKYATQEKKNEKLARLIRGYATPPKVAQVIGCNPNTARKKMKNPDLFTVGDLGKISRGLHIPIEELRGAISV